MSCLRAPASLADLAAILQACGGQDWANLALLGLASVLLIAVLLVVGFLALRQLI